MIRIINCTPHAVKIFGENGEKTFSPSGIIPRVSSTKNLVEKIDGIEVYQEEFGEVVGLPKEEKGVYYIVSRLVAQASHRSDLLVPGELVRDENGQPVGAKGFCKI